jgi:isochorismate pyruvate lyase
MLTRLPLHRECGANCEARHMAAWASEVNLDSGLAAAKEARMSKRRVPPALCRTMEEVRSGVDRLDQEIVALLAERFRYMEAAARIKPDRAAVRDEARKAEVIGNARRLAEAEGSPIGVVEAVYERLVEGSIAYEFERFDATRA